MSEAILNPTITSDAAVELAANASRAQHWAGESESPIGRYAAALACGVLGEWRAMRLHADAAREHDSFPATVADALAFIATENVVDYDDAVGDVLESFETREAYLEDIPVADTVLVLQALAGRRGMAAELQSDLLP